MPGQLHRGHIHRRGSSTQRRGRADERLCEMIGLQRGLPSNRIGGIIGNVRPCPTDQDHLCRDARDRLAADTTEQLLIRVGAIGAMSDPFNRDHNSNDPVRSRWVPLWIMAVILIAIGVAVWGHNRPEKESSSIATVQSKTAPPAPQDDINRR